ncbi:DUF6614 family protein [Phaeovulum sp. NW3]|uniref:DUF6614 family protein n=1 Tax=Phaeovulum sp. NW3 TaxID=2934933 RepID=UPI002020A3D0|nr:DUF6614 family protein [Phaeovulum sp. NW3]MCL7463929.1 hypothetical protein [Phaeovulum sp. NW3]
MNLYHCMIELKSDAKALAFSAAVEAWMGLLQDRGLIRGWRLLRRKLGLAADGQADFLLELEVDSMTALDAAFTAIGRVDDAAAHRYDQMHGMIARAEVGLYRPFPDPERRERIALI